MVARIAGLSRADRRTEILRSKDDTSLSDRATVSESDIVVLEADVVALGALSRMTPPVTLSASAIAAC